jgi:hypothetical protein
VKASTRLVLCSAFQLLAASIEIIFAPQICLVLYHNQLLLRSASHNSLEIVLRSSSIFDIRVMDHDV